MLKRDQPLAVGLGTLLSLIRGSQGLTRAELGELTGLARSTVTARLAELVAEGLVVERPASIPRADARPRCSASTWGAGVVLAIDAGASRIASRSRTSAARSWSSAPSCAASTPAREDTLRWACAELDAMLADLGRERAEVRCVGVGLPGSVDFKTGRPVSPHRMPGWDAFPVADTLRAHFGAPVLVDNDVNVMALGEAASTIRPSRSSSSRPAAASGWPTSRPGRAARGAGLRGRDRAHPGPRGRGHDLPLRQARLPGGRGRRRGDGGPAQRARDRVRRRGRRRPLARAGVPEAIAMVRSAGHAIGFVMATVVNVLNPSRLVVAGDLPRPATTSSARCARRCTATRARSRRSSSRSPPPAPAPAPASSGRRRWRSSTCSRRVSPAAGRARRRRRAVRDSGASASTATIRSAISRSWAPKSGPQVAVAMRALDERRDELDRRPAQARADLGAASASSVPCARPAAGPPRGGRLASPRRVIGASACRGRRRERLEQRPPGRRRPGVLGREVAVERRDVDTRVARDRVDHAPSPSSRNAAAAASMSRARLRTASAGGGRTASTVPQ